MRLPFAALVSVVAADSYTSSLELSNNDFVYSGGAGTGDHDSVRSGSRGQQQTLATLKQSLQQGTEVQAIAFEFRYISGYGPAGQGQGSNFTLKVADSNVYSSQHFTEYSHDADSTNYSTPIPVTMDGLTLKSAGGETSKIEFVFDNNDRNVQLYMPLLLNVTCAPLPCVYEPPPIPKSNTTWQQIGPSNIGDSVAPYGGESGQLMDAASPFGNPNVIYAGGDKNGGSTGVLKSVDKGQHWFKASMFEARVRAFFIVDQDKNGDHVLCGTAGGLYETTDGGKSWTLLKDLTKWGVFNSFRNGTINGKPYILAGTEAGIANRPLHGGDWNVIPTPEGHSAYRSSYMSASDTHPNSVVGGCIWGVTPNTGVVHIATIINETAAVWKFWANATCASMAMDPNDPTHFIHTNNSRGLTTWETTDGGESWNQLLGDRGVYYVAIDRKGWIYSAAEAGAYRSRDKGKTWEAHFVRRVGRLTNETRDRVPHDYNRIILDFAGGMAFPSDQGLYFPNKNEDLLLYSANGDMNNNLALMHSVAMGEEPGLRYIVTALWDWSPVASWDGGAHWPSTNLSAGYIGEGGGAFGIGKSPYSLIIHHHNIGYSHKGGKDMVRWLIPNGASVGGTIFTRKAGSRSEPNGPLFALMNMGQPAWDTLFDRAIACTADEQQADLGVTTNHTCLARLDMGTQYKWYSGANYAVWNAAGSHHCVLCKLSGSPANWTYTNKVGAISYPTTKAQVQEPAVVDVALDEDEDEGKDAQDDRSEVCSKEALERARRQELGAEVEKPELLRAGLPTAGGGSQYIIKSPNFGANWTWTKLSVPGITLQVDPTDNTVLYGYDGNGIYRSHDQGDTWGPCEKGQGLEGRLGSLEIKDSQTMIRMRSGDVPLRTTDGGRSWQPLDSVAKFANCVTEAQYSWSGKTLVLHGLDRGAPGRGERAACVFVSRDDGETWIDETDDINTMNLGDGQWYEDTFYMSSYGQGIIAKVLEPAEQLLV